MNGDYRYQPDLQTFPDSPVCMIKPSRFPVAALSLSDAHVQAKQLEATLQSSLA